MTCSGMSRPDYFKPKYHSNPIRDNRYEYAEYGIYEYLRGSLLPYYRVELVGIHGEGIIEGYNKLKTRMDLVVKSMYTGKLLAYVEITGDVLSDTYARFLLEKVEKAKKLGDAPTFFVYYKCSPRKRIFADIYRKPYSRVYTLTQILRYGKVQKWLRDEKPYYVLELTTSNTSVPEFSRWFRSHYAPCAARYGWKKCLRLARWAA